MDDMRLPKAPRLMGTYWDVPSTGIPAMASRWQIYECNGQKIEVFFRGCCLNCGRTTWNCADGTTLRSMEYNGLVEVADPVSGAIYRACYNCGTSSSRSTIVVDRGRDMVALPGEDPGPLVWPRDKAVA